MRIMCLNGWGGKLHSKVLPYLVESDLDVLCLQEVVHSPEAQKEWLTYRDGAHVLEQRARFFDELCEALPDHVATFCPAARGVLWDEDQAVPSFWGLATFVRKTLPIVGQVQGFVHKDFGPDGYGAHPRSRSAHGVRLYDDKRKKFVSILHMHGLRDLAGKMDTSERAEQAERFKKMAQDLCDDADDLVLCGDFNVEPESETLKILETLGVCELVTANGFQSTRNTLYTKPGRFADYMLVNVPEAVKAFDVVYFPEVSDHCPLVLEL